MSIFSTLKRYEGEWKVTKRTDLSVELGDQASSVSLTVVPSEYGMSVEFSFDEGYKQYIPVSTEANLEIGDTPKVGDLDVITLQRGSETIYRIDNKTE